MLKKEGAIKMCELFGVTSKNKVEINGLLKEFYSHSVKHCHGWGLAKLVGDSIRIKKEKSSANKSEVLKKILNVPISTKIALAHIRYATIGQVEDNNSHPFTGNDITGRQWTLIHNGTILCGDQLNKYIKIQEGATDSERILLYFIELINNETKLKKRSLLAEERFSIFDNVIGALALGNKLNLLFYDGELFYVHVNFGNSLHYKEVDGATFFSTTPLDKDEWYKVPFTRLLAYKDGEKIYEGIVHNNDYKDNPKDTRYIYQYYSEL